MREINSMGKGWFIVKLAIDKGILPNQQIDFGMKSSKNRREKVYKETANQHAIFIDDIVKNWDERIALEGSKFSNQDLKNLAIKLQKII